MYVVPRCAYTIQPCSAVMQGGADIYVESYRTVYITRVVWGYAPPVKI